MTEPAEPVETAILTCPKCGFKTRHERESRERHSALRKLLGHPEPILQSGYRCTKCGQWRKA